MSAWIKRLRVVAVDLDGTLIDSQPDLAVAANVVLESLDLPALPPGRVGQFIGGGIEALVRRVLEERGQQATARQVRSALGQFQQHYRDNLFVHSRVFPGVIEGLDALRASGLSVCCITNKAAEFAQPLLAAARLDGCLDAVFCAAAPEQRKPGPWLLRYACRCFGITAQQLLMIGDSRNDIAAARAAGCRVAAVDYGYNQGRPIADDQPDWIISSLLQVMRLPPI